MPGSAWKKSSPVVCPVTLRTNGQRIFHKESDSLPFIEVLHARRDLCGFQLCTRCLMPSHTHLPIRVSPMGGTVSRIMKHIGTQNVF